MTNFFIGGAGGEKLPKARALPEGTEIRLAEISVQASNFKQTIRAGSRKGEEINRHQLKLVYETLVSGTTLAYKSNAPGQAPVEVAAHPFEAGDKFVQYLGGVYPKDEGGVTFTQQGSAYAFIDTLAEQGVKPTGNLEDYVGLTGKIAHIKGRGPAGPYVQALIGTVTTATKTAATAPAAAPVVAAATVTKAAPAKKTAAPKVAATATAPTASGDAFAALTKDQQEMILEALKQQDISATDLMEAGIATSADHGTAILATVPGRAAKNPLVKKGA